MLLHQPILPGDTFATVYIHSLELTPVWEYFMIGADYAIVLTDTVYESSGAGLPIPIQGEDTFTQRGNQFHISQINRILPSIDLRIHPTYQNRFIFNRRFALNLSELLGNTVVRLRAQSECAVTFYAWEFQELLNFFTYFRGGVEIIHH